jgi:hypothetical protein
MEVRKRARWEKRSVKSEDWTSIYCSLFVTLLIYTAAGVGAGIGGFSVDSAGGEASTSLGFGAVAETVRFPSLGLAALAMNSVGTGSFAEARRRAERQGRRP